MVLFYERINWENYPSMNTAISALNLNKIDLAVKTLDERTVQLDTAKAEQATVLNTIQDWSLDESTGIITITKVNGGKISFDLNIEKIPVNFELSENGILSMTTDDGTMFTADIGSMIPIITFESSDTVYVEKLLGKKTIGTDVEYNSNLEYEFAEPYNGNLYITPSSYASGTIGVFYDVELHSLYETTYSETVYVQEQKIIPCTNIEKIVVTNNGSAKLTIAINDLKNATYKFEIPDGAITEQKLNPNYLVDLKLKAETATQSATSASASATQASESATRAYDEAERAKLYADTVQEGITTTTDRTLTESHAGGLKINSMDGESQQDGTPTPDTPIDIKSVEVSEIKTISENLVSDEYVNIYTNPDTGVVSSLATVYSSIIKVKPNTAYRMERKGGTPHLSYGLFKNLPVAGATALKAERLGNVEHATITTVNDANYILLYHSQSTSMVSEIQFYEHEKSIQLSAPITLRGIDDVKDVLCKRDGVFGVLRNFDYGEFNDISKFVLSSSGNYIYLSEAMPNCATNDLETNNLLSNYALKTSPNVIINGVKDYGVAISSKGSVYFRIGECTTKEEYENKVDFSTTPLVVVAQRNTPTFELLPVSDQIALHQLETFDTVTYISTDSEIEPIMEVEYGTSKVGAYTIKGMNTADANALKIEQLNTLTNELATQLVAGSEV